MSYARGQYQYVVIESLGDSRSGYKNRQLDWGHLLDRSAFCCRCAISELGQNAIWDSLAKSLDSSVLIILHVKTAMNHMRFSIVTLRNAKEQKNQYCLGEVRKPAPLLPLWFS